MKGLIVPNYASSYPVEDIKRTLDAMSWVKVGIVGCMCQLVLNLIAQHVPLACSRFTKVRGSHARSGESNFVFSFPLVLPGFEELAIQGAYSAQQRYSTNDLDDVVSYAAVVSISLLFSHGTFMNVIARDRRNAGD